MAVELRKKGRVAVCIAFGPSQLEGEELTGGNTGLGRDCPSVSKAKR